MERFLKPGDSLWDIGANIGTISLHFAQPRYQLGRIEVFEPNPDLVTNLRMIFENLPLVRVNAVALGERKGEAHLHVGGPDDSSTGSLVNEQHGERQISVALATGDSFWRDTPTPAPAVIKIDVEGYEPQVFAGLQDLIAAAQPVIFFEHLFLTNEQIQVMIPTGYTWFLILDEGGLTQHPAERTHSHDSVLVPPHRMDELPPT